MNSELEVFNDPDVIVAQTQAGVSSTIFQAAPVTGGAVTSIGGATGGTITISSSAPDGISITPTGLPGTLTLTVVVTNAPTLLSVLGIPQSNYSATTAPTVGDDSGDGYSVGSVWVNVTTDTGYLCVDATLGAAVWKQTTA